MKKLKSSNGFTLVELIVVIAMLAILSSVSIGGFEYSQKRAAIENDKALVKQLNQVLDSYSIFTHNEGDIHNALIEEFGNTIEIQSLKFGYDIYCYKDLCEFYLLDREVYEDNDKYISLWQYLNLQVNDSLPIKEIINLINYDKSKTIIIPMSLSLESTTTIEAGKLYLSEFENISSIECEPKDLVNYYDYKFTKDYEIVKDTIYFYRPGVYLITYTINGIEDYRIAFVENTKISSVLKTAGKEIQIKINDFVCNNIQNDNNLQVCISVPLQNIKFGDYYQKDSYYANIELNNPTVFEKIYIDAITIIVEIDGVFQTVEMDSSYDVNIII